jgi:cytochrome oxidase Cu insertion factor (SCO1/SenC/PrrC family)
MGMIDGWHFVTGPLSVIRKVWKDYHISVEFEQESPATVQTGHVSLAMDAQADKQAQQFSRGLSDADNGLVGSIIQEFGGGYEVSHDIPFWIVDKKGMMRDSLEVDATPADIASDIRTLLFEK